MKNRFTNVFEIQIHHTLHQQTTQRRAGKSVVYEAQIVLMLDDPIWWNLVITLSSCNDVILYVQQTYVLSTRRPTQQRKSINQNSARIIVITSVAIVHLHKQLRESHEVRATNFSYGACGKIIRRLCQTKQQHGTMPQWMPANTKQSHPLLIRGLHSGMGCWLEY